MEKFNKYRLVMEHIGIDLDEVDEMEIANYIGIIDLAEKSEISRFIKLIIDGLNSITSCMPDDLMQANWLIVRTVQYVIVFMSILVINFDDGLERCEQLSKEFSRLCSEDNEYKAILSNIFNN